MNKPVILILLLVTISFFGFSQGFSIGGKSGLRNTWIFNNSAQNFSYTPTLSTNFGGAVTYYFIDTRSSLKSVVGLEVEYLYNSHTQNYEVNTTSHGTVATRTKITSYDIPILFRFKPSFTQRRYIEVGVNISSFQEVGHTDTLTNFSEVTDKFQSKNLILLAGVGSDFRLSNSIYLSLGFRAQLGLADIGGVNAIGQNVSDNTIFKKRNSTSTFDYGLLLGIHYLYYRK